VRLLVGFDGSDQGRDALELARVLGSQEKTTALVVTVMPYDPLPITSAELERDAAAEAEPLFEQAREDLSGFEVETRAFGGGSPSGIVTDLAEREDVDAIVIGSSHRGPIGRALLGGVGRGLLGGAPVPVAVAPRGYAAQGHGPLGTVAVAFDGTPEARRALIRARELAEAHRSKVLVLTVVAPPVALPGVVGYTPVNPPDPQGVLEAAVGEIEAKVAVEGRELSGPPAETLAEACESGVDLLVAGSRGYGPLTRVLLGSVTAKLIDMSPCPVLVVPRP
jgi:nucleotide-binding universal stress UspA family protein